MLATQLFKCLADETRLKLLLMILAEHELCVCELTQALDASQPKISRHLALLRETGLLDSRRQGQWIYYRISPSLPEWVITVLQTTLRSQQLQIQTNVENLQQMRDRPGQNRPYCS